MLGVGAKDLLCACPYPSYSLLPFGVVVHYKPILQLLKFLLAPVDQIIETGNCGEIVVPQAIFPFESFVHDEDPQHMVIAAGVLREETVAEDVADLTAFSLKEINAD